jgi:hypothetical protein
VRDLVHAADPAVEETIMRRVQPYFVLDGTSASCSRPRITIARTVAFHERVEAAACVA